MFWNLWSNFRQNIAAEFTRASIKQQKQLAATLAQHFVNDIYIFDEINYFCDAIDCSYNSIRYKYKNGKFAVLSFAAQKTMRDCNQFLQFNDNKEDVSMDKIGVFFLFEAVLLSQASLKTYKKKIEFDDITKSRPTIKERTDLMRKILNNYDKLNNNQPTRDEKGGDVIVFEEKARKGGK
uniref:Nonstructural protein WIV domain-containing protein n=1 Tax=Bactrocera dorsalis TaxID=27457 RepID=A0A034VNC8_BACDO